MKLNYNFLTISGNMDDYSHLFTNHPSKMIILIVSAFLQAAIIPFLYSIISFERDNHHRTLINRLMASTVWLSIIWGLTVQQFDFFRSVFGPMPEHLCRINSLMRTTITMHGLMLIDAILVVKYIFIFHMKNPTAVQDDFWNFFLICLLQFFHWFLKLLQSCLQGQALQTFLCVLVAFLMTV